MALVLENFKEVGGPGNSPDGGQMYSVFSDTDTLATMLASGYLDGLTAKVNVRDIIVLSGTDGSQLVQISSNTGGVVQVVNLSVSSPAQAISGPGAVDIIAPVTDLTTTGADAYTFANGAVGQKKTITLVVDAGNAVITPATRLGYATITMADAGDTVQLEFKSGGWAVIGQGGLGTGPVVA